MFSTYTTIWLFTLLWSGLCNDETRRLQNSEPQIFIEDRIDDSIKNNVIPIIQSRNNKGAVKKSLDDFTMVRRKTHFAIPGLIANNNPVNINKDLVGYENHFIDPKSTINIHRQTHLPYYQVTPRYNVNNIYLHDANKVVSKEKDINDYVEYEDLLDIAGKNDMEILYDKYKENNFENVLTFDQETELLKVLRKQKELIKKIKATDNKKGTTSTVKKGVDKNNKSNNKKGGNNNKTQKDAKNEKGGKKKDGKKEEKNKDKGKPVKKNDGKNEKTTTKKVGKKIETIKQAKPEKKKEAKKETKKVPKKNDKDNKKPTGKEQKNVLNKKTTISKNKSSITTKKATTKKTTTKKATTKKITTKKATTKMEKQQPTIPEINDFYDLIAEVERKREQAKKIPNYTPFNFETTTESTTTTPTTTTRHSTVLTIFNELHVRSALKNDPYVRRILQMANRKRQKYMKDALFNIAN